MSGNAVPAFRVRFPSDQAFSASDWYQETLQHEGWHLVLFQDLKQAAPTGTPFDASGIVSIEFEIPASRVEAIPWDFCIDGLIAVK